MTDEAEFLYRIRTTRADMLATGPTSEEARLADAHFEYLRELLREGRLILAGRTLTTDESSFGIVVFRAPTLEAARQTMLDDPAVKAGLFTAEVFPCRVALCEGRPV
jgi:uncharacterized protein YciI